MKILGVGITGLVGSRIVATLHDKYEFENYSLETGFNITDPETMTAIKKTDDEEIVLHLAAKADVDGCEEDKPLGKEGLAHKINVVGTQNIVDICNKTNKKLLYISTDFVFDGEKTPNDGYTEEDAANPINWYGETKYLGEEIVRNSGIDYTILRIAYPYHDEPFDLKSDIFHAIRNRLSENKQVAAITDHLMTPVHLNDLAVAIDAIIQHKATGTYHVVGSESLTPHQMAMMIADKYKYDKSLISEATREEYFKGRAARPFNLTLNNAKIKKLGVTMRTFTEALAHMQIDE